MGEAGNLSLSAPDSNCPDSLDPEKEDGLPACYSALASIFFVLLISQSSPLHSTPLQTRQAIPSGSRKLKWKRHFLKCYAAQATSDPQRVRGQCAAP